MAERSAVNRIVAGSIPACGAFVEIIGLTAITLVRFKSSSLEN